MSSTKFVRLSVLLLALGSLIGSQGIAFEPSPSASSTAQLPADPLLDSRAVAELDALSNAFTTIAEVVKPSVVNIQSISSGSELTQKIKKIYPDADVQLRPMIGTGSGVIIDPRGFIVTNNHVVADANAVHVTLFDGRKFRAQVVGVDSMTDVAVIKIEASGLKAAVLGDSDRVKVGQIVLAIGSPFRLGHSVSHGIISAMGRSDDIDVSIDYKNWLQTDAPINPGNSGGPLISTRGEIIGINVAIATDSGGHQGVGFAIPSNTVRRISSILKTGEKIVRGYLGVQIQAVDEKIASGYGLIEPAGVFIGGVGDKSPAAKGGLKPEDIVLAIDGKTIRSREQLQEIIADTKPGSEVAMDVWRRGKSNTLRVKVEAQPKGFSTSGSINELGRQGDDEEENDEPFSRGFEEGSTFSPRHGGKRRSGETAETSAHDEEYSKVTEFAPLGFDAETMSPELIKRFKVKSIKDGVLITRVDPASEAFACGLRGGIVIVRANDKPVRNAAELGKILAAPALSQGVRLKLSYRGDEFYLVLRIR